MLNSAEHEIFSANKYENANNSRESFMFSYVSKKELVIVSNLRSISRTNFMLSWAWKKFYNLAVRLVCDFVQSD